MKIAVVTFAFAKGNELRRMILSAGTGTKANPVQFHIVLHSQQPDVVQTCKELAERDDVTLIEHGYNRGLARSMNDVMAAVFSDGPDSADVLINANDDIVWSHGDVLRLAQAAKRQPELYHVAAMGWHGQSPERGSMGYCAVAFNPIVFETIGCFDENFFPAFWEDVDYHRRATLAGLPHGKAEDTNVFHITSVLSAHHELAAKTHNAEFLANEAYFRRKWGQAGEEFSTPFNGGGTLKILPENRRAPFGPFHDRPDLPLEPIEE